MSGTSTGSGGVERRGYSHPVVEFVVEEAGCESCAGRLREALSPLATVTSIEIDENADAATVRVDGDVDEERANAALAAASRGSGHTYRVRPGSWSAA